MEAQRAFHQDVAPISTSIPACGVGAAPSEAIFPTTSSLWRWIKALIIDNGGGRG